jgi:hypothetical protein
MQGSPRLRDAMALAAIFGVAVAMAAWTWRTWPDLLIDFGREAYVAWRLAEGEVLHRDVVYVSGPLSPYWNSLAFRLFGAGLDTLFSVNAAILAALVWVWYVLLRRIADRWAAWAGCTIFVGLFGFSQYVGIGNYNYLAPYSHELPHGLLLASLGFLCWERCLRGAGRASWACAGVALGLVALTKMEVFAAAAVANGLGFLALAHRNGWRSVAPGAASFLLGLAVPLVVATIALSAVLSFGEAVAAIGVGWLRVFGDEVAALPFYQSGFGTDDIAGNLARAALWAARITGALAPAAVLALFLPADRFRRSWTPWAFGAAMVLALAPFHSSIPWLQAARPLPFVAFGALALCVVRLARARLPHEDEGRLVLQAMLLAFATALLAKIFLNARIYQYGFVLALPATLLLVAALVCWIPRQLERRGGLGAGFRGAALGLLAVTLVAHVLLVAPHLAGKTSRIGGVDDAIRVRPGVARVLGGALEEVHARTRPGQSLAVLPEGVMLNFLARRPTATPHFSFNPFELLIYGEEEMIRAFEAAPPAAIVLIHHDTSEHGARFLGRDYGVDLLAWITQHYVTARQIGDPPLQPGTRVGVAVLEPRAAAIR